MAIMISEASIGSLVSIRTKVSNYLHSICFNHVLILLPGRGVVLVVGLRMDIGRQLRT